MQIKKPKPKVSLTSVLEPAQPPPEACYWKLTIVNNWGSTKRLQATFVRPGENCVIEILWLALKRQWKPLEDDHWIMN